jgi:hypothetical protein
MTKADKGVFIAGQLDSHFIRTCSEEEIMQEALDTLSVARTVSNPQTVERWAETLWSYGEGLASQIT